MRTLASLLEDVRRGVGGNREIYRYEEFTGLLPEERLNVTPVNKWQKRILSELEFAITLSAELDGKYDGLLRETLEFLKARLEQSGVISNEDAQKAEEMILAASKDAKEYNLILCAHAHIDMNWMWSWQETVAATLDTFRTMLAIMREYPQFCYSQSQSSVYEIVEKYEPSMMEEIKQRIKEGRWEVTAAAWVETDKNMPSTESLARHILYTKRYMRDTWGVDPDSLRVDFSPDTFGHSANLPELNRSGNVDYYYHCRGNDMDDPLYRWQSPSGKEILVYREPYWYNGGINPRIGTGIIGLSKKCGGLKTGMIVYGVGDHGGGPTRRDVELAVEMQEWPVFPGIRFGTFHEFFKKAEEVRDKLPLVDRELNYIFTGCYTTQSRIKLGNRQSEAALYRAEAESALSYAMLKMRGEPKRFEDAWRNVLFTHFHDIITGSCVQDSREYAMGLYQHALAVANTQRSRVMRAFTDAIDTSPLVIDEDISSSQSEGAGAGYAIENFSAPVAERGVGTRRIYTVFNPSARARKSLVEITVWDWRGVLSRICFTDSQGNPVAHQLLDKEQANYWGHTFFRVLAEVPLPPMGYETIVMDQRELETYPVYYQPADRAHKPYNNYVLENEYLRAEFCYRTGSLISLITKPDNTEMIDPKNPAGLRLVTCDGNADTAWVIGRYMTVTPLTDNVCVSPMVMGGELRDGITVEVSFMSSKATAEITLDRCGKALNISLTVDWHEISRGKDPVPTLIYAAPLSYGASPVAYNPGQYLYDIPGGAQIRDGMHMDVPAHTYAAAINPSGQSLAIATDCKYGFRGADGTLSVTLIHPSNSPDPYPERGIHHIDISLLTGPACPKAMKEDVFDALNAPAYASQRPHTGSLPMRSQAMELNAETTAVISAIKHAEDGEGIIVRLYETCGKDTVAQLTFGVNVASAKMVNIEENPVEGDVTAEGGRVSVNIGAYKLATVHICFE